MNLILGVLTMVVCMVTQAIIASLAVQYYGRFEERISRGSALTSLAVMVGVMVLLLVGNFAQIILWAGLFLFLGEFEQFVDAVYHSAVNFATLGYGDIVMSEAHRMLGPLEAINGVLMIGVSTAVLMSAIQDAMEKRSQR